MSCKGFLLQCAWSILLLSSGALSAQETAARAFLPRIAPLLGIDPAGLALDRGRSGRQDGHLWNVDFNVRRDGLVIEGARVVLRVNNGRLIEIGAENLPAPGAAMPRQQVSREQALAALD